MEKILKSLGLILMAILFASNAEAQRIKFMHYPQSNVYYNPAAGTYIYSSGPQWVTVRELPANIRLQGKPRVIYYNGNDVWNYNKSQTPKVRSNNRWNRGKKKSWSKGKGNKH